MIEWFYSNWLDNFTYLKQLFHRNKPTFLLEYENLVCVPAKLLRVRRVSPFFGTSVSSWCHGLQHWLCSEAGWNLLVFLQFSKGQKQKRVKLVLEAWNSTHFNQGTDFEEFLILKPHPNFNIFNKKPKGEESRKSEWHDGSQKKVCYHFLKSVT